MKIEGLASYLDTADRRHNIEGIGSLPDGIALQKLNVSGSFSFEELFCDNVKSSGEVTGKILTGKKISAEGTFEVDSVKVETFKLSGSAEIENLVAEEVIIESRGGSIGSIKCGKLKIFHEDINEVGASIFTRIFGGKATQHKNLRVRIKNVNAETIHLENCAVVEIKCKNAFIGANCVIDKLHVSGECKVADDSTVGETIRTNPDV